MTRGRLCFTLPCGRHSHTFRECIATGMTGPLQPLWSSPELVALVAAVITLAVNYQRSLSWTEYKTIHALKRGILPLIDKYTGVFVVSRKRGRDDAEYISTVEKPLRDVFKRLNNDGFSPHVINSIKQRPHPDGGQAQYSDAHLVKIHNDGYQSEIYLFAMGENTDIYCHVERSVTDPKGHLLDTDQQNGDIKEILPRWVDE